MQGKPADRHEALCLMRHSVGNVGSTPMDHRGPVIRTKIFLSSDCIKSWILGSGRTHLVT
jgi:hypothetical protein